jgi:hypothetical protein
MRLELLDGERLLHTSRANAIVVPSDYGLSQFAAGDLLGLAGLGGREAIGGHLYVTSLRRAFAAHAFNRLKGVLSVPLPAIHHCRRWQSGPSVGVEVSTAATSLQFVSWSRSRVLAALESARRQFGSAEHEFMFQISSLVSGLDVRATGRRSTSRLAFSLTRLAASRPGWGS